MSVHSSLRSAGTSNKHRSVLKRYERLKSLKDRGLWNEEKSVMGLLKVKQQRVKVKKEKVAADAKAPAAGATTATPAAASATASSAKSPKK